MLKRAPAVLQPFGSFAVPLQLLYESSVPLEGLPA